MKEVEENSETGLEIAIIGMACRFPGANNIGQFWTNLKDGVESISFLSEEELAEINPELRNKPNFVKTKGGILDNFDCFDAFFFNYTPSEAEFMAPSMRLFHECAWEALEDSGYVPGQYHEPIGLYVGIQSTVNWENLCGSLSSDNEIGAFTAAGLSNRDYMSTMIAYKLNLIGPSFSVNTACSTSLVAVHLACQGLLSGDCRMALAGGAALRFPRPSGSIYEEGMIISPDGHTRTFDAAASGTTGSDGIGAVILKQLEDAVSDGDHIYAVIKGSAINNDGNRKVGYTAPSIEGQAEVICKTYQAAEINPEDIGYIEAHGTATPLGDVTEVEALKIAFNTNKKHFCRLGSVKTNLGHLDIAAGIAGFIKTVLILKNKQIPPSLHFQKPNPAVDFENSPFYINTKLEVWENNEKPRRTGVSSFGIGGTNAHVVLEEYKNRSEILLPGKEKDGGDTAPPYPTAKTFPYLFLLSAKTQTALNNITINLAQFLRENPGTNLADVAYTLQVGRKHFPFRKKLVSNSLPDTIAKLSSPTTTDSRKIPSYHLTSEEKEKKVIFMFPGLGPQYVNMGLDLYQSEPLFRAKMDHCFAILKSLGCDIKEILYPPANSISSVSSVSSVANFEIAQFVIFSIEYALAHLIMSWGIKPYAMIGYSFGEYAAACIAGVFKLEDILKLLVTRGKLISALPSGMMLSVPLNVNEIKSILPAQLAIAIDNGSSCVISGPAAVVQTFAKELKTKKIICLPLDAAQAIHSPMMEPILEKFTAALADITLTPPQIPYISTVTGNWIKIEDAVSPNYWAKQLRETVYFARGIENLNLDHDPNIIFLEVGPGRDISALVEREINEKGDRQKNSLKNPIFHLVRLPKKEIPDDYYLLDKIGLIWLHGVSIDWQTFSQGKKLHRIPLPTYPFDKHRFWQLPGQQKTGTVLKQYLKKERKLEDCFYIPSWKQTLLPSFTPQSDNVPVNKNHYFLIFLDQDQDNHKYQSRFAMNLIQHLKQQDYQVITAAKGEIFSHENDHYIIAPGRKEDYDLLIQDICTRGMEKFPARIIYLWTLGKNDTDQGGKTYFQKQQEIGYYSFLYLAQALIKQQVAKNPADIDNNSLQLRIEIVSDYLHAVSSDEICPEKVPVIALCKTIPQEYPNITCRSIDIRVPLAGSWEETRLIDRLTFEFITSPQDLTVAYRRNTRWVKSYEPFRLETPAGDPLLLRHNGVYLITGGLGNDSFIRAKYLAENFQARLVLTGRTPLPEKEYWSQHLMLNGEKDPVSIKIKRIQELESLGAEVLALSADVSDELDMRLVMREIDQRFGILNGVIHAAGITNVDSSRLIIGLGREESEWHFQPKVYGLYVLDKILTGRNLDFCLLTSSIVSIIGGIGISAYIAASIFMDTFARHKNNTGSSFPWMALNWVGSGPGEIIEVFKRVLAMAGIDQVVFSQADLQQLINERIEFKRSDSKSQQGMKPGRETVQVYERPALSTPYIPPRNTAEQKLADIWQRFFGIDKIGVTDDIFDLGGDSLKAMNILAIVQKELNFSIPLKEFFDNPTIEGAAKYISESEESVFTNIRKAEKKDFYELSINQKRLWFIQQMNPCSSAYNTPGRILLNHQVKDEWIELALTQLTQRHESMQTSFQIFDDQPVQRLMKNVSIPLRKIDLSMMANEEKKRKQEEIFHELARTPFNLMEYPLFRAVLLKLDEQMYEFMFNLHHIINDGWSLEIIIRDFNLIYEGLRTGKKIALDPIPFQYLDFVEWYNEWLKDPSHKEGSHLFWKTKVEKGIPDFKLPGDFAGRQDSLEGAGYHFILSKDITGRIKLLAEHHNTTLFTVMFSVYMLLLARLSGEDEVACSIISAGREHAHLHPIVGFFANSLIYNTQVNFKIPFNDFLEKVKRETLEILKHQNYPLEPIFEELGMKYPEISLTFNMLSMQDSTAHLLENAHIENIGEVKFDLEPYISKYKDGLRIYWTYKKNMFRPGTIAYIAEEYAGILDYFSRNPDDNYIDYRKSRAVDQIIPARTAVQLASGAETLAQVFEHQVDKTPHRIAIKITNAHFTYNELNRYAGRIAYIIEQKMKLNANKRVGLLFEHGYDMIAAIMGTLKAGKTYVPLSASYPLKRLLYMLTDSDSTLLLTNTPNMSLAAALTEENQIAIGHVEEFNFNSGAVLATENPGITAKSPAYILYTSGSTGNPKGVMQTHENVLYFIKQYANDLSICANDRMTLLSSFAHDAAVMDIYGALLNGATLYPLNINIEANIATLASRLKKEEITIWHSVPTVFRYFSTTIDANDLFPRMRLIVLGGEAVRQHDIKIHQELFPHSILCNLYGQTESSYNAMQFISPGVSEDKIILGKIVEDMAIIIMDNEGNEALPLETGEIVVSSPHLASGYWKNEKATQQVFSIHPVYGRIYRTGDIGRLSLDGSIEFIGRKDTQVKIRGFRIELSEIESRLLENEYITEAVVKVIEAGDNPGDKYLGAYIVCNNNEVPGEELSSRLRAYLAELLPDYMIPAYFMLLERLPLTPGGKIDRKALPLPDINGKGVLNRTVFAVPRTWVEIKLQEIWSNILKTPGIIGIKDNFFQLGGHSLRATTLASRIQKVFNVNVPLVEIFKRPTIEALAQYINGAKEERYASLEPVEKKEYYPLSPAQKRLYILHRMESESIHYNLPQFIPFPGTIDIEKIQGIFKELIQRHESLRTSFLMVKEEPVQRIQDEVEFEIEYKAAKVPVGHPKKAKGCEDVQHFIHSLIRPFDLSQAPLLRAAIINDDNGKNTLIVDIHHIITDGTSNRLLKEEFDSLYQGKNELVQLHLQYKDYAHWQNSEVQQSLIKGQEIYWQNMFSEEVPVLNLPTDYPRPNIQGFEGSKVDFILSIKESNALKGLAKETGVTLYMSILSVFIILLSRLSGQEDIVVGTPTAGRRHADLEKIIGMFVNTLALRNNVPGETCYKDFVKELKDRTLKAYENQEYQFESLVEKINVIRDVARNPLFDVMFNLLNMESDGDISFPEELENSNNYIHREGTSRFDLTLTALDNGQKIYFSIEYYIRLFKPGSIERFIAYLKKIIEGLTVNTGQRLSEIEIIPLEEKKRILYEFNDTGAEYPANKTIHHVFAEQVEKTPDHIAFVGANRHLRVCPSASTRPVQLTYNQLNEQSDQLAGLLIEKGVLPDNIIGIMMERSVEMIMAIFGILKSGGAYLPIDPGYPQERIDYMLKDSGTKLTINYEFLKEAPQAPLHHSSFDIPRNHHSKLAYVIYTSGSTGNPKGVMIEHAPVLNFIEGMIQCIDFKAGKKILALTTISFDIFGLEVLLPLCKGMEVVMANEELQRDIQLLKKLILKSAVEMLQATPTRVQMLIENEGENCSLRNLKEIMVGGETLPAQLNADLARLTTARIYNMYGPTETTIWSTVKKLTGTGPITIGKPITNTHIYILNKHLQIQPLKVPGEMYIGGHGTARGYLNQPELTAERFINFLHSAFSVQHSKLYRTGDLARWLEDGSIEFLGRMDYQVKVKGYRIELEEIEKNLKLHEHINDAVVVINGEGIDQYLCAYIVSPVELQITALREYLARKLPEYMIPSSFIKIDKIPFSLGGKIDRKALRNYRGHRLESGAVFVEPSTDVEKTLAALWKDVLKLEKISVYDNFFEIGGNSLKAVQLNDKLREIFKIEIPAAAMFRYLNIHAFTKYLNEIRNPAGEQPQKTGNLEALKQSAQTYKNAAKRFRKGDKK